MTKTITISIDDFDYIDTSILKRLVDYFNEIYQDQEYTLNIISETEQTTVIEIQPEIETEQEYLNISTNLNACLLAYNMGFDEGSTEGYKSGCEQTIDIIRKKLKDIEEEYRRI